MSRIASSLVSALVALDATASEPLYRQLYHQIRAAILDKRLASGVQLPSSRELARELGVARNTVLNAVEQLIAEGYLQGARGSGTYVTRTLPDNFSLAPKVFAAPKRQTETRLHPATKRSLLTDVWFPQLPPGEPRPFRPSGPALDAFPAKLWLSLVQKHWKQRTSELLAFGDPAGLFRLRQAIAAYLTAARAVRCAAEQVIIVAGAQQALDLLARLLVDPGDAVWIEEPGYLGARAALQAAGARLVPVPVDNEGLNVQVGVGRGESARLIYVTPSHQFPLGVTMSLARRLELLSCARRMQAWVVEDDYDSEYRYCSRPVASLQGLDSQERVIYVGTFSKVLFPSLRLGYVVLPPALVEKFILLRSIASGQLPLVEQSVLAEFIEEGHFGRHLRRMRTLYEERGTALYEEAQRQLAGLLDMQPVSAGMRAIGRLQSGIDDRQAAKRALAQGVETVPLSSFSLTRNKQRGLMLGFTAFNQRQIRDSVRKLAIALMSTQEIKRRAAR